jgi:hypothetical protein
LTWLEPAQTPTTVASQLSFTPIVRRSRSIIARECLLVLCPSQVARASRELLSVSVEFESGSIFLHFVFSHRDVASLSIYRSIEIEVRNIASDAKCFHFAGRCF